MSQPPITLQPRITVKQRAVAVAYAREHGIKRAARHFAWSPRTVRTWVRRWEASGEAGLQPKSPSPRGRSLPPHVMEGLHAAFDEQWETARTRAWLEAAHNVRVSTRTIQRVFRDIRVNDPTQPANAALSWQAPTEGAHA